jgi:hypothetical protein
MWTESTSVFDFTYKNGYYRKKEQTEGKSTAEEGRDHVKNIARW